jgi:hypothetical protein
METFGGFEGLGGTGCLDKELVVVAYRTAEVGAGVDKRHSRESSQED